MSRSYTYLNRNEFAMSREDDFAQSASVRSFVTGAKTLSETEQFRLAISPDEPFRTKTFTDDPETLEVYASMATRNFVWRAYADGKVIASNPADGLQSWIKTRDALAGYVARERINNNRTPEAAMMDKVAAHHVRDITTAPLSVSTGDLLGDPYADRLPLEVQWIEGSGNGEEGNVLPYREGITEAAYYNAGTKHALPSCE